MGATAHRSMPAEAVRIGAQRRRGFLVPAGYDSQAQHLLSGARPNRDAIGARGRLQCNQRIIRISVGYVAHALLLDQMALTRKHFHEAHDELVE